MGETNEGATQALPGAMEETSRWFLTDRCRRNAKRKRPPSTQNTLLGVGDRVRA